MFNYILNENLLETIKIGENKTKLRFFSEITNVMIL